MGGDPEGNGRVPQQGEGEEQPDIDLAQPQPAEIKRQDDRQEAVSEQAQDARAEEGAGIRGKGEDGFHGRAASQL